MTRTILPIKAARRPLRPQSLRFLSLPQMSTRPLDELITPKLGIHPARLAFLAWIIRPVFCEVVQELVQVLLACLLTTVIAR